MSTDRRAIRDRIGLAGRCQAEWCQFGGFVSGKLIPAVQEGAGVVGRTRNRSG